MEQELLNKLMEEPFYVKSSKGNLLSVRKINGVWYAQGVEVTRKSDIEYLEKEAEKNKQDFEKEYNSLLAELDYELWDSGNLSISQQKILDYLLEKGIVKRDAGKEGVHDTANGVAKWIYSINEILGLDDEQTHRLNNKKKSNATKLAWKRNRASFMSGVRKRERDSMKRSFYDVCKDMNELQEAKVDKDNVFDSKLEISLESIAGGVALSINKDNGNVSFTTTLNQSGSGMYRLTTFDDAALKTLFSSLKEDLLNVCKNFDEEINQMIAKNGLKSTK